MLLPASTRAAGDILLLLCVFGGGSWIGGWGEEAFLLASSSILGFVRGRFDDGGG